jgi:NADH:ubiquinone oxidoreductase subunit F (NADH-binding)
LVTADLPRILDPEPVTSLAEYIERGGGAGLEAAAKLGAAATIEELDASGLRGRGGAGFPTGTKWRTVAANAAAAGAATVVVNGAEGEPGSFKDRTLLARNPYRVLEGALIAADTVGAERVVVAVKATFAEARTALQQAIDDIARGGWGRGIAVDVVAGPEEYLFGEETGLLEVVDGRPPFPRVAPPYRDGPDVLGAPPTLANNVETLANVACILANGPAWFRQHGTERSPGTIVCTVSGATQRAGVAEVAMGTPLRTVIDQVGGGPEPGRHVQAVLSGVAHPLIHAARLDTPLTYEDMEAAGSGLGACGFIVFDDAADMVAVAQGVARFLAVESCGQCTPCKQDGLAIAEILDRFRQSNGTDEDVDELAARVATVTDEARCFLAQQQQRVVNSLLGLFPGALARHMEEADDRSPAATPVLVAPLVSLDGEHAVLDEEHAAKQPDWTYDAVDSGAAPAERLATR